MIFPVMKYFFSDYNRNTMVATVLSILTFKPCGNVFLACNKCFHIKILVLKQIERGCIPCPVVSHELVSTSTLDLILILFSQIPLSLCSHTYYIDYSSLINVSHDH